MFETKGAAAPTALRHRAAAALIAALLGVFFALRGRFRAADGSAQRSP